MRIDPKTLNLLREQSEVVPGNIYPGKGGSRKPGTDYWLVIACSNTGAHLIGFDGEGHPVSTASYGKHALRERPLLGKVDLSKIYLGAIK